MESSDRGSLFRISVQAIRWGSMASTMTIEVVIWAGLGYLGDRQWGTSPWLLVVGISLGSLAFGWRVRRLLEEIHRPESGNPDSGRKKSPPDS